MNLSIHKIFVACVLLYLIQPARSPLDRAGWATWTGSRRGRFRRGIPDRNQKLVVATARSRASPILLQWRRGDAIPCRPARVGGGVRAGVAGMDQNESAETTSPPLMVLSDRQVMTLIEFFTNWTWPSASSVLTPPEWKLRAALNAGELVLHGGLVR